jgi:hypothetical protein
MEAEQMHVVVEPSMYEEAAAAGLHLDRLFTFTPEESGRCGTLQDAGARQQQHQHRISTASAQHQAAGTL